METEVKETRVTNEGERLAQVINEWRDCGQGGEQGSTSSNEAFSEIVNQWRGCGDANE